MVAIQRIGEVASNSQVFEDEFCQALVPVAKKKYLQMFSQIHAQRADQPLWIAGTERLPHPGLIQL